MQRILEYYVWPKINQDVKAFVGRCSVCQQTKHSTRPAAGGLHPLPIPSGPWEDVTVDLVTGLPEDKGFTGVCTVVDRLSKEVVLFPISAKADVKEIAEGYRNQVWKRHGLPKTILSDRGPQFASVVMKELCGELGIRPLLSSANHPQTDGQSERTQQTWERYLRAYVRGGNWVSHLAALEFAYNTRYHESIGMAPFHLTKSFRPRIGQPTMDKGEASAWAADYKKRLEFAKRAIEKVQGSMTRNSKRTPVSYKVGDLVYLSTKAFQTNSKLDPKWVGPFEVTEVLKNAC